MDYKFVISLSAGCRERLTRRVASSSPSLAAILQLRLQRRPRGCELREGLDFKRDACRSLSRLARRRVYLVPSLGGRWCLSHACRSFQKTKAHSSKASHIQVSLADKSPAGMR